MAYLTDGYHRDTTVAAAVPSERVAFIQRTYAHLAGAVLAFVALEFALINGGLGLALFNVIGHSLPAMLLLMVVFIGGGYVARWWAYNATSRAMQYAGLGLYVVIEAVVFMPLLYIAANYAHDPNIIAKAGIITLGLFAGLTTAVMVTGKDFSFLGPILSIAGWSALALIVAGMIFGFGLGVWYSYAMVVLAGGYIVYDTSNVMHRYRTNQHVAAALELFASVALLFYYVLRILLSQDRR